MNESDKPRIGLDDSISSLGFEYEQPDPPRSPNPMIWAITFGIVIAGICLALFISGAL